MRNLILLLVLISVFAFGYLVGDYRSKAAREALEKAIVAGKTLEAELQSSVTRLQTELDGINEKHHREIEAIRKGSAIKAAEWRRIKDSLDDAIKRSSAKLAESEARLKALVVQRDAASGADKDRLDMDIEHLQKEVDDLRREIEGSACLHARVPHSVTHTLRETDTGK